jgi:hypothetical protein
VIWVTWRQHRWLALIGGLLVAAAAAVMLVSRPQLMHAVREFNVPCRDDLCVQRLDATLAAFWWVRRPLYPAMLILPGLVGLFVGAPLLARELEHRTHHLAWTQSITRRRWLLTKLGLLGGAVVAATALLGALMVWWERPLLDVDHDWWSWFDGKGLVPPGYALFAFALGVTAGTLIRRTIPAMVVTLALFVAARMAVTTWLRPRFRPPMDAAVQAQTSSVSHGALAMPPPDAWVLDSFFVDPQGRRVSVGEAFARIQPLLRDNASVDPAELFKEQRFVEHVLFHPGDRLWLFQSLEAALFVMLALLLLALTVWWAHRHTI